MLKNILTRSPEALQNCTLWAYSKLPPKYKYGKDYVHIKRLLETTRNYNEDQIREFQFNRFLSIYRHALKNIPFYKKWYAEHGLKANSIKSPEDITKIPILTKDIVRENLEDLTWPLIPEDKIITNRTGGTTGQPVKLYLTKSNLQEESAFIHNIWKRNGYKPNDFMISFMRSKNLEFKDGIHQFRNFRTNRLFLSSENLNKIITKKYTDLFKKKQPKYLCGYPVVIFIFAQIIKELKISMPKLKGVFCASQKLLAGQREIIEKAFGCRVFTHYGMGEKVILAAECEYSHDYHVVPEYGYAELIENNGQVINAPNTVGELVGTGFYNKVMPLIRYRMEDLAVYRKDQTCKCGRPHEILSSLIGRTQDFLVLADGTLKGTAPSVYINLSKYCRGFQLAQEVPGKVEIRVIPKSDNPPDYKEIIEKELKEKHLAPISFKIVETSSLEKSSSGKPKFLIQKLKIPHDNEESITYFLTE